ncbi:MAG: hypothetical protein JSS27_02200 [Planctomycetes bacterium]|nr:hypothetical protein [Planctomycetota bacterium]
MSAFKKILTEVGEEMSRLGVQGQMELANALFNGSGFVPYGPGQWKDAGREGGPEQAEPQQQIEEQSHGIEM